MFAHNFPSWAFNLGRSGLHLGCIVLFGPIFNEYGPDISSILGEIFVHYGNLLNVPQGWVNRKLIVTDENGVFN